MSWGPRPRGMPVGRCLHVLDLKGAWLPRPLPDPPPHPPRASSPRPSPRVPNGSDYRTAAVIGPRWGLKQVRLRRGSGETVTFPPLPSRHLPPCPLTLCSPTLGPTLCTMTPYPTVPQLHRWCLHRPGLHPLPLLAPHRQPRRLLPPPPRAPQCQGPPRPAVVPSPRLSGGTRCPTISWRWVSMMVACGGGLGARGLVWVNSVVVVVAV